MHSYTDRSGRTWIEDGDFRLPVAAPMRLLGPIEAKSVRLRMHEMRAQPATRKIERADG